MFDSSPQGTAIKIQTKSAPLDLSRKVTYRYDASEEEYQVPRDWSLWVVISQQLWALA